MKFTTLAIILLGSCLSKPEPVIVPAIMAYATDDMIRDRAVLYWSRLWDVDAQLMLAISHTEVWNGDPTIRGPWFCYERSGDAIDDPRRAVVTSAGGAVITAGKVWRDLPVPKPTPAPGTCLRYTRAVGIMQVEPLTHLWTDNARMCQVTVVDDLEDAYKNACLGILIYRSYLRRCAGDRFCALSHYGGAVQEWTKRRYIGLVTRTLGGLNDS